MGQNSSSLATNQDTDRFNGIIPVLPESGDMAPEDRRRAVLRFMNEHGLALKPKAIYRNLRLHHRITFGDETVKNILHELTDEGLVRRVDPDALEDSELVNLERGEGRGAYIITEEGREYLRDQ